MSGVPRWTNPLPLWPGDIDCAERFRTSIVARIEYLRMHEGSFDSRKTRYQTFDPPLSAAPKLRALPSGLIARMPANVHQRGPDGRYCTRKAG